MQAILRPLVLVLAVPLAAQATGMAPAAAESLLPASTYAALRFGGLSACRQAAAAMPMAAAIEGFLARLPAEVRSEKIDRGLERAAHELQSMCEEVELRPNDVRQALGRPMALGFGRLTIEGMGPSVALVIEAGEHKKSVGRLVQWGAQRIAERAGGAEFGEIEVEGRSFHSMQVTNGPALFAGAIGDLYVITNSRGYLGEMLGVAAGKQKAIGAATRLGQLAGTLPAPALASLFVNAERLSSMFSPHLPYEASDWSAALGLGAVDALYWATTATAGGGTDLLHLGVGGSEKGLLKALLAQPADLAFARACSANTVMFAAGSVDIVGVMSAFERFAELLPEEARAQMQRELRRGFGRGMRDAGTTPEHVEAMVRAFGSQVGVALSLEKGAVPKPELLVRIAVRDAQVVRSLLQQLEGMVAQESGLEWKTRQAGDDEVRFCNVQIEQAKLQLSPCYALTADALWFGSDAAGLARAMRRDDADSLAGQPDFLELAKRAAGASGVMHWRLFRAAEIGWRTVETMVYPQLDAHREQVGFGSEALPDAETMAKALGTCTSFYRVDDDGVTVQGDGTLTFGALLAAFGFAGDEVLSRAAGKIY